MSATVILTHADLETVRDHGTMVEITGTEQETGDRVTFAGDHRPMHSALGHLYTEGSEIETTVEPWAIIRREQA